MKTHQVLYNQMLKSWQTSTLEALPLGLNECMETVERGCAHIHGEVFKGAHSDGVLLAWVLTSFTPSFIFAPTTLCNLCDLSKVPRSWPKEMPRRRWTSLLSHNISSQEVCCDYTTIVLGKCFQNIIEYIQKLPTHWGSMREAGFARAMPNPPSRRRVSLLCRDTRGCV